MTSFSGRSRSVGPDVNFIPLSLVQQVEVLPVSSSALYLIVTHNPGGWTPWG